MTDSEQFEAFVGAIGEDPTDRVVRDAFTDWLLEQGRDEEAQAVRDGWDGVGSLEEWHWLMAPSDPCGCSEDDYTPDDDG